MLPNIDHIPLSRLPRLLREFSGLVFPYWRLHQMARDGYMPAITIGARWYINRSELPAVVRAVTASQHKLAERRAA